MSLRVLTADTRTTRRALLTLSVAAGLLGPTAYAQAPAFNAKRLQALQAQLRNAPNVRAFLIAIGPHRVTTWARSTRPAMAASSSMWCRRWTWWWWHSPTRCRARWRGAQRH